MFSCPNTSPDTFIQAEEGRRPHIPHGTIGTVIQGVGGVYERFANRLFEESENGESGGREEEKIAVRVVTLSSARLSPNFHPGFAKAEE